LFRTHFTVLLRRNLTGNTFANGIERVLNRYENVIGMGNEQKWNRNGMEMEQIRNGNGSQKWKKAFSRM